ncbi:MAG: malonyl-CoA decarboxylase [Neomegalonema sp.]|nr:malonyl-CoA decarboxylase [Neomegalonema sp.]
MSTLNDLLVSILERGARLVDWSGPKVEETRPLPDLCAELMGAKGEASGVALAAEILRRYGKLNADERLAFFEMLAEDYDIDAEAVAEATIDYGESRTAAALSQLVAAAEPRRQELLRRLNFAPDGTRQLVDMRRHLLGLTKDHPHLMRIDHDMRHLFASWFNRGFLVLSPIDWTTSAHVLEKIIAYEAVHEINSWDELRRRLQPPDRRCFAFFHPSMPDEPLIFVEVALSNKIETSIQEVLSPTREIALAGDATTAVFYSISNCQAGLRGISFGAFLIKQVAEDLARALPRLDTFVTLSPIPGFARWLRKVAAEAPEKDPVSVAARATSDLAWAADQERSDQLKPLLMGLAATYFLEAKREDGEPIDSVARFHLGNGASLAQINWRADLSAKGLAQSCGLMVNYRYDLNAVEDQHEAYASERAIEASRQVRALLPSA